MSDSVKADSADVLLFRKIAADCQRIARYFGDRQNSESKLTAKECTGLVTTMLNAGNLLAEAADRTDSPATPKEPSCPSIFSPPTSPTPPSSPHSATN